ncbi:MAG: tetratricopeptide repeat protein, partial [Crocinitomicaceae bacterium]
MNLLKLALLVYLFNVFNLTSQIPGPHDIDSVNLVLNDPETLDTAKIRCYYFLASAYVYQNPDTAAWFVEQGMNLSEKLDYTDGMGEAYGWLGYLNAEKGNIPEAIAYNLKSLDIAERLELENSYPVILNNLGNLHQNLLNHDQAIKYFNECAIINKKFGYQKSLATNYNNLGLSYRDKGDLDKSLNYFSQSLAIRKDINDQKGISYSYSNIGSVYQTLGENDKALEYTENSITIRRKLDLKKGLSTVLYKAAELYRRKGNLTKAKTLALESESLAVKYGYTYEIQESAKVLYLIYKSENNISKALAYHETYASLHDSLNSIDNQKIVLNSKYQFEYNKKALIDSLEKDKILIENKLLEDENSLVASQNAIQKLWLTVSALGIIILLGALYFYRKNTSAKMDGLRSEIKLRLNETLSLKDEIETLNSSTVTPKSSSGLNI